MFVLVVLGWIGITVGALVVLALIDLGRAAVRRLRGRTHRSADPSIAPSLDPAALGGSPSRPK